MDTITKKLHIDPILDLANRQTKSKPNPQNTVSFAPESTMSNATADSSSSTTTTTQPTHSADEPTPVQPQHTPPPPFTSSSLTLLTQGAEALVYRTTYLDANTPIALKYRPQKPWRHRTLDLRLTRARILSEARVLAKCRKEGVLVPGVLGLDWEGGWLALEWVSGWTVRRCLDWWKQNKIGEEDGEGQVKALMERIGRAVGRLHETGVVHGDLTTSNLMLRPLGRRKDEVLGVEDISGLDGDVVLIDFGLAAQNALEEDKAVDLYVLERAFGSTHPEAEGAFKDVLRAYGESYKGGKIVLKRLEDVRMRGRKKSMLG